MYYSKEELERMRKQGEAFLKEKEEQAKGYQYESSVGVEEDVQKVREK